MHGIFPFFSPTKVEQPPLNELPSKDEKVSVLSVEDVVARDVNEQGRKVIGSVDLGTVFFNETWGSSAPFNSNWICRHKNFFLAKTKSTQYEDRKGNRATWFKKITGADKIEDPDWKLLEEKRMPNGKIERTYGNVPKDEEVTKHVEYGFTVDDPYVETKQGERFFNAFHVIGKHGDFEKGYQWEEQPGKYRDPEELKNYEEFCRVCNVARTVWEPKLADAEEKS